MITSACGQNAKRRGLGRCDSRVFGICITIQPREGGPHSVRCVFADDWGTVPKLPISNSVIFLQSIRGILRNPTAWRDMLSAGEWV